jgi:hypothetical protein
LSEIRGYTIKQIFGFLDLKNARTKALAAERVHIIRSAVWASPEDLKKFVDDLLDE